MKGADLSQNIPNTGNTILQAELNFNYPDYPGLKSRMLFEDLVLSLERETMHLVLGGADQGKTTLARILLGLIPLYTGGSFRGNVFLNGKNLSEVSSLELLKTAGMIFQDPEEQLISPRCDQEIAFGLESAGLSTGCIVRAVEDALDWAGLSGFGPRNPATLSGGEQKRLLAAVLKAQDPELWILDEVFEELDENFRRKILNYLRERKKTVLIFASKYHSVFKDYSPEILMIEEGRLESPGDRDPGILMSERGYLFKRKEKNISSGGGSIPEPGKKKTLLELENIAFSYHEGDFGLKLGSMTLFAGETLAFLGPNGSGKSTLAKILCGLIRPESGNILLALPGKLKTNCGYLFQNPDYQLFLPTVGEELLYGFSGAERKARLPATEEASVLFGLPSDDAPPALLGYGMRRKLQGAVAWMQGRQILILDEGDSGLDYSDFLRMVELLKSPGRCLILISHQREAVMDLSDRIFHFEAGRVREEP